VLTRNFQVTVRFSLPSFASNREQMVNLVCAQANSASYPPWDRKWVVTYRLWAWCGWLGRWYVC